jgi:multiple sugar transport system ATP-binding protein
MAEVKIAGLHKRYGPVQAVRGVDLEIPEGEFTVLVGPSGCGKSTLLRSIAGLEEVDTGTIEIGGEVVNDMRPRDRDVAMVFQNYALYPYLTVFENIAFGLRARRTPQAEVAPRVQRAARMLGIDALLGRYPRQLSGGQRQRVAIGRAIVRNPRVFLFDEPLSNLDAQLRDEMRGEIKRLHQEIATTMIYVTHDQVEAMTLARPVGALGRGLRHRARRRRSQARSAARAKPRQGGRRRADHSRLAAGACRARDRNDAGGGRGSPRGHDRAGAAHGLPQLCELPPGGSAFAGRAAGS